MPNVEFNVVSNPEALQKAFAIRTLVYIGEQACPWDEEFDGNDYCATQILGTIGGEPVATARIRWFGTFAKLERLALRAEHRGNGLGHKLLSYLLSLCRAKGYDTIYLHAQARLEPFYRRYGFDVVGSAFAFSDHHYVEMVATYPPLGGSLELGHGPYTLNRPEGTWSEEGILEKSVQRTFEHLVPSLGQCASSSPLIEQVYHRSMASTGLETS